MSKIADYSRVLDNNSLMHNTRRLSKESVIIRFDPSASQYSTEDQRNWLEATLKGNEFLISDAVEFVSRHPQLEVTLSLPENCDDEYYLEIFEIDTERRQFDSSASAIKLANCRVDIVKRINGDRVLMGRVYGEDFPKELNGKLSQ